MDVALAVTTLWSGRVEMARGVCIAGGGQKTFVTVAWLRAAGRGTASAARRSTRRRQDERSVVGVSCVPAISRQWVILRLKTAIPQFSRAWPRASVRAADFGGGVPIRDVSPPKVRWFAEFSSAARVAQYSRRRR